MNLLQRIENLRTGPGKAMHPDGQGKPLREEAERHLVARIMRGDARALETLYADYRPRVHRFLARLGCSEDDFDEVCNEVFYVVWCKAGTYNHRAKVSTWILGITRNKGLKLRERARLARDRRADVPLERLVEPTLGDAARLELDQWLEIALAALPDEQRMVMELTFIDGLSYEEISAVMDCPVNTVKTRMFNARRKLKQFLPAGGKESSVRM